MTDDVLVPGGAYEYLDAAEQSARHAIELQERAISGTEGLLIVGDYLSDVEIPWISEGGSLADYRATLATLRLEERL